jgi:sugar lactone lactonase YvrE
MQAIRRAGLVLVPLIAAASAYLLWAPTRIEPVAWTPPAPAPALSDGPYAANERLAGIERIARIGAHGPESLAVAADGTLYTGFEDGRVARFDADGGGYRLVADTGGRPLGVAIHPGGGLVVADAYKGLLRVGAGGDVTVLSSAAEGEPFGFTDDVAVDAAGRFAYFTDASSKWGWGHGDADMLEHGAHGRLLRYDFASGHTAVLLRGLQFANGVALAPDEEFVLVNESAMYRVRRFWLQGARAGHDDVFVDNLPGFPDNVRCTGERVWVAIAAARSALLDRLAGEVAIRTAIGRLLALIRLPESRRAMALGYDRNGRLIANLQSADPNGYFFITQVTEAGAWVYFSSLAQDSLGRIPLRAALSPRPELPADS